MFRKYPTIASNGGIVSDNINRKAASIELYLPDNIIKYNGEYCPIHWKTISKTKNVTGDQEVLYQGAISHKKEIKDRFHEVRNKIERGDLIFKEEEWKRMKKLLETIVFAFNKE